jgi:hypothetical protein
LRVGLLTNPHSGGNRNGLKALRSILAAHPEVRHRDVETPSDVAGTLADFARDETDVVAINGGDGTVHAVLNALFRCRPFDRLPLLAVPRAGTASMTARDVGLKGSAPRALRRLFVWARTADQDEVLVQRPVLRVRGTSDQAPLYGMFFGAGAIHQGIEFFHRRISGLGLRGEISSGVTLASFLLAAIRRKGDHVTPVSVDIGLDGGAAEERQCLALIVSTLERLIVGLRPFFGTENGPLHFTALGAQPRHLLRALPFLVRGRPCRHGTPENGYLSHNAHQVRLGLESGFTLDGEVYTPDIRRGPVLLEAGGQVSFVRL